MENNYFRPLSIMDYKLTNTYKERFVILQAIGIIHPY